MTCVRCLWAFGAALRVSEIEPEVWVIEHVEEEKKSRSPSLVLIVVQQVHEPWSRSSCPRALIMVRRLGADSENLCELVGRCGNS